MFPESRFSTQFSVSKEVRPECQTCRLRCFFFFWRATGNAAFFVCFHTKMLHLYVFSSPETTACQAEALLFFFSKKYVYVF